MRAAGPEYKSLNRALGKALHDYEMIREGDRILVGLSGGADSLSLLWMLAERRRRVPVRYTLRAVHLDPGFGGGTEGDLAAFCARLEVPFVFERTDFGIRGHSAENRENPCFLCSRLRRKRLFEIADGWGCRTLALGHNQDDVIETLLLNMCYAGEIGTLKPLQELFAGRFRIIRPFAYAPAALIRRFARRQGLPVAENPCPSAGRSRRSAIRRLLHELYRTNPKVRGNLFHALRNVRREYLLP